MRLATIDIGSNTILLLVADVATDGTVQPVLELQELPRLGKGVDRDRRLLPDAMERSVRILERYVEAARAAGANRLIACGTSALRDAVNRDDFIRLALDRTGLAIRILTGVEEAERTYAGAVADLLPPHSGKSCAVLDIGGGSTEIVFGRGRVAVASHSVDIGAVRLTERFFARLPPPPEAFAECQASVRAAFQLFAETRSVHHLIAVAGTPVTLASMLLDLPSFDPITTHGKTFPIAALRQLLPTLKTMSALRVAKLPQVEAGREDVLLAGVLILVEAMDRLGAEELQISSRGLRYGIVAVDGMCEQE